MRGHQFFIVATPTLLQEDGRTVPVSYYVRKNRIVNMTVLLGNLLAKTDLVRKNASKREQNN